MRGPFVTFDEPGFPTIGGVGPSFSLPDVAQVRTTSVSELVDALHPGAILAWRHGAAFPADAWPALHAFLSAGGSWLQLGGAPFTRPVTGRPGTGIVEPFTLACTHALRLNQVFEVAVGGCRVRPVADATRSTPSTQAASGDVSRELPADAVAIVVEPRFTDVQDVADESGSPGEPDAIARPLLHVVASPDARHAAAPAAWAIDRLRGAFAGGRWTFWTLSSTPTDDEWTLLRHVSALPPFDLQVTPEDACPRDGEAPTIRVRLLRPRQDTPPAAGVVVAIDGDGKARGGETRLELPAGPDATTRVELAPTRQRGLHRVRVSIDGVGAVTAGFHVFDPDLFASGATWTHDAHVLRRDGRPAPLVGTTFMSSRVHREFLFRPDAAEWDASFAEIAALGMNVVRTGLWSGWSRAAADTGDARESFLRALEAYYLSARAHGLSVVFTLFAFTPHGFGSGDPYFDPRALAAQRAFVASIARRFAAAREFLWDLINEPSVSNPAKLWVTRPVGTTHEHEAFTAWLAARFATDAPGSSWEDVVRRRWRLAPGAPIGVPADEDFDDAYAFTGRHPYRAADYTAFTKDAFAGWAASMRDAIRSAGSTTPITVGQDEGGLVVRPTPATHADAVDFTSMHTWWNNDAQLWDSVVAKVPDRPLIVSETGMMLREHLSRTAVRSPGDNAALLSRKLAYAFAAGASGVIQWCYDVNPFMNSDNEVHIGLKRVDGSVRPEHAVLGDVATFVARNAARFDGHVAPGVVVVVPSHEQHTPRDLATLATRRVVRVFAEQAGVAIRAVDAARIARDLGSPRVIVLPSCRGIDERAWRAIADAVERGATLACSGWFETDDAGLPAERLGGLPVAAAASARATGRPPARSLAAVCEARELDGTLRRYRFSGTLPESWLRTDAASVRRMPHGRGTILHHPLPIDWADADEATPPLYEAALAVAGVSAPVRISGGRTSGRLLAVQQFSAAWLLVGINDADTDWQPIVSRGSRSETVTLRVAAQQAAFAFVEPSTWKLLDTSWRAGDRRGHGN